jgi:hypothetical protein
MAFQQTATVVVRDINRCGRMVDLVYVNGLDVNAELVRGGDAWVCRQYSRDPALLPLKAEARAARQGLGRCRKASGCRRGCGPGSTGTECAPSPAFAARTTFLRQRQENSSPADI